MAIRLDSVVEAHGSGDRTQEIVALVADALQRTRGERKRREYPWVTDASKECDRAIHLDLANAEREPWTTDSLVTFGVGSAIEDWLADLLQEASIPLYRQVRAEFDVQGVKITGKADLIGRWGNERIEPSVEPSVEPSGARATLVEIKSINTMSLAAMLKRGERGKEGNRKQVNLYVHASKIGALFTQDLEDTPRMVFKPFDSAILLYVATGASIREPRLHAWTVPYDADMARQDLLRLARLQKGVVTGAEPPPIPDGYSWSKFPCSYCSFRSTVCFPR